MPLSSKRKQNCSTFPVIELNAWKSYFCRHFIFHSNEHTKDRPIKFQNNCATKLLWGVHCFVKIRTDNYNLVGVCQSSELNRFEDRLKSIILVIYGSVDRVFFHVPSNAMDIANIPTKSFNQPSEWISSIIISTIFAALSMKLLGEMAHNWNVLTNFTIHNFPKKKKRLQWKKKKEKNSKECN